MQAPPAASGPDRLRRTLELSSIGMACIDPDGHFLDVNSRFCALLGYTEQELLTGLTMLDVTHPEDRDASVALLRRAGDVTASVDITKRYVRKDGGVVWVRNSVSVERSPDGRPTHLIALIQDISEQKRTEAALEETELRLQAVINQTFGFLAIMTPDGRLVEVNETPLRSADLTRADVVGRPVWETAWWSPSAKVQQLLREDVAEAAAGRAVRRESVYYTARGAEKWLDRSVTPIKNDAGEVVFVVIEGRDLTERRRAEHYARRLNEAQVRQRQALELNDTVVQGLAAALLAIDHGLHDEAGDLVRATLHRARQIVSDLLDRAETRAPLSAGDLVRGEAATVSPGSVEAEIAGA